MIQVVGDKLYQWDSNRQVLLSGQDEAALAVHFAQVCSKDNALVVEIEETEEGQKVATIPNSLLVEDDNIYVWTWDGEDTISGRILIVTGRNKPSDYIYTPTEVLTIEKLMEWVKEQLESFEDVVANNDYVNLKNKPSIEGVELNGDKNLNEFGINLASNEDIDKLFE